MKLLFLDFDGVLNSAATWCTYQAWYRANESRFVGLVSTPLALRRERQLQMIGKSHLRLLDEVLRTTGASVVVSSSWRHGETTESLRTLLRDAGLQLADRVIGRTPDRPSPRSKEWAQTEQRGSEIARFLLEFPHAVEGVCILDDDADMGALTPWLVQTITTSGLLPHHLNVIVEMLDRLGPVVQPASMGWRETRQEEPDGVSPRPE